MLVLATSYLRSPDIRAPCNLLHNTPFFKQHHHISARYDTFSLTRSGKQHKGDKTQMKGKVSSETADVLKRVQHWKRMLEIGMLSIFIGATLSLDFYFCAIRPTHYLFVFASISYFCYINFLFRRRAVPASPPLNVSTSLHDSSNEQIRLLDKPWVNSFTTLMGILSIAIPWALILADERRNLAVLAPHLYVTSAHTAMEIISVRLRWAAAARVLIPLAFIPIRLPLLFEWYTSLCGYGGAMILSFTWTRADRLLALLNFVLWSGYFFAVHIPRCATRELPPPTRSHPSTHLVPPPFLYFPSRLPSLYKLGHTVLHLSFFCLSISP
jgi:hypothetical protein